ncbi:hypothetical protein DC31_13290 [Microbacterium sp. CH12i]|uniref:hypothetical protein n=1 Tax=Microbacterium sp. CH12i TaxID=1479651 RepID=UPI000461252C|nr:hypothetical protein [Microbacterium sp. CH12i]KDA06152.1 hypothetical protein DC31_13290 [Microbacterium sp. CH12i]
MSRRERRRGEDRRFTVEAVPRSQPDLHKLAQVFLGMAVSRSKTNGETTPDAVDPGRSEPDDVE